MRHIHGLLRDVFHKGWVGARLITAEIGRSGVAPVGVYTPEVAEMKERAVRDFCKGRWYSLSVTYEKV